MKSIIGLDIGTQNLKLINLALKGKEVELLKFDIVEIPQTSNQCEKDSLLKSILKSQHLKLNLPVCLSVSTEESFFKIISIKSKGKAKLKEAIQEELRKNVVFSLEDCIWDYSVLKHKPKEMIKDVLLVAAKKEAVSQKINLIQQLEGFAYLISLDILASYNCLRFNGEIANQRLYALVDIAYSKTQVLIFDNEINFWIRTIPFGGNKFDEAIAKSLGLSLREAQEYKKEMFIKKEILAKAKESIMLAMKNISTEIDKTLNYYYFQTSEATARNAEHKIDEILLSGGGSLLPMLDTFLNDNLKIPTRYVYPLRKVSIKDKDVLNKKDLLNNQSPQLTTAVGLALSAFKFSDIKINLIKDSQKSFLNRIRPSYLNNFIFTICVALLVFFTLQRMFLNRGIKGFKLKLKDLNIASKEYIPELINLKQSYDSINFKIFSLNNVVKNRDIISNILYKLSEIIPKDAWVTNIIFKLNYQNNSGELTISGNCKSYAAINELIAGLKDTGYFKAIKPVSSKIKLDEITKEEMVNFTIKLETKENNA